MKLKSNIIEIIEIIIIFFFSIFIILLSPILKLICVKKALKFQKPKSIVITGASSGIGKSLACKYASIYKNDLTLLLIGRNKDRLNQVKEICQSYGSNILIISENIKNKDGMKKHLIEFDLKFPIDLLIANAGAIESQLKETLSFEEKLIEITDVNINGMLNTVLPVIPLMESRGYGQIAIVSSLVKNFSSFFPGYSSSKAYISTFTKTLRNRLLALNIGVYLIEPGFVSTPMTESLKIKGLFEITVDEASSEIIEGIKKGNAHISFPMRAKLISIFSNMVPLFLMDGNHAICSFFLKRFDFHNKDINNKNKIN
ncbi:hypothetical protein ACTA71_001135 [Dictyostelium dimigraforme]